MQMARPTKEDFAAVCKFFADMESVCEEGVHPETGEDMDVHDRGSWLDEAWKRVNRQYSRVVWGGQVAIDNACDPNADALEFKPEIRRAVACHDALLAACKAVVKALDYENASFDPTKPNYVNPLIVAADRQIAQDKIRAAIAQAEGNH